MRTDCVGPLASRRGRVLFSLDLTFTLGPELPSPHATLMSKLRSVDGRAGLIRHHSTPHAIAPDHESHLTAMGHAHGIHRPHRVRPRDSSASVLTRGSQFLLRNLYLCKCPVGFPPHQRLRRTPAQASAPRKRGTGPGNPDVTLLLSAFAASLSISARVEKVERDPGRLTQTVA